MDVLMLGGTRFLGIHLTDALRARGHRVTRFTRGTLGDRRTDLARLGARTWDAVVDTCGYAPRDVEISARYFAKRTGRYVFVSTISVYEPGAISPDEDAPVLALPADRRAAFDDGYYGAQKAACERVVVSAFRERALVIRPGLIAGPHDPTDRFTYWPVRFDRGGTILAPESSDFRTQFVDARDIADFTANALERGRGGTYNVTSPPRRISLGDLFATCRDVARVPSAVRYASAAFLAENAVEPWSDLPLWVPDSLGMPGLLHVDVRRALVAGLRYRPLRETVRDTLAWHKTKTPARAMRAGLSEDRERNLLALLG
ncbi:MAG: NAD-dependent epimerase/dehydratase family protein [Candidatus Eremiobacterales bacterium]